LTILKNLKSFFVKKKKNSVPLFIIKKRADVPTEKEFISMEEIISLMENDPNIPKDKLEKLRSSLNRLKNNNVIKIKNGRL